MYKSILIFFCIILIGCSTEIPEEVLESNRTGELRLEIDQYSLNCTTLTFFYDNNYNNIFDAEDEEIISYDTCSESPKSYYFFQDAPNYECPNGGIQIILFLDLNSDRVYQTSEPVISIQSFCFP